MSNARSQQKRKERKRKKRKGLPMSKVAGGAKAQLQRALEAVEELKALEGVAEAAPLLKVIHAEVEKLGSVITAVIEDQEALNEEVELLKEAAVLLLAQLPLDPETKDKFRALQSPPDEDGR